MESSISEQQSAKCFIFIILWLHKSKGKTSKAEVICLRAGVFLFCFKKDVLRNFTKFTGNHLCQGLFNKVAGQKSLWHRCFPVNFIL